MASAFDNTLGNLGIGRTGVSVQQIQTAKEANTLSQSDFLQLMTAQLKNQDPFEPVDNTQMVAQMAQFSSLAGISEMNTTLAAILAKLGSTTPDQALSWVGKTVLTEGNVAYGRAGGGISGSVELDGQAADVTVSIQGPNGEILRTLSLGPQNAGTITYDWDGTTDSGNPAGDGPFTIRLAARGPEGGAVTARSLVWAPVASVSVPSGGGAPVLMLPGIGEVPVSAVRSVG